MNRDGARLQVFLELRKVYGRLGGLEELVIVDEHTIERDWGWVFYFTSRSSLNADTDYANVKSPSAPYYMVNRDGSMWRVKGPIEKCIYDYELQLERESGAWELFVDEPSDCSLQVAGSLRKALNLTILELGVLRRRLPTAIAKGAFVDLEPVHARLIAAGVRALVRRSRQGSMGTNQTGT